MSKNIIRGRRPKTTTKTRSEASVGSDPFARAGAGRLQEIFSGGATGDQSAALGQLRGAAGGIGRSGDLRSAGTGSILDFIRGQPGGQAGQVTSELLGGATQEGLAEQLEAISAPVLRDLQRRVLPSISSEFAGDAAQGSGAEFAAIQDAKEAAQQNILAQAGSLLTGERDRQAQLSQAELDRRFNAARFFPTAEDADLREAQTRSQLGSALGKGATALESADVDAIRALSSLFTKQKGKEKVKGPRQGGLGKALGTVGGGLIGGAIGGPVGFSAGQAIGGSIGSNI